jgi:hypothetical protein
MNVFNRLVVILLLLAIIFVALVVAIAPLETLQLVSTYSAWLGQGAVNYNTGSNWPLFAAGRVVIGGAIVLLCLILLWLELRRPRRKTIRVQKTTGGEARITIDSIAQRLAYNIDQLPDVVKVTPRITGRARTMDMELLLETSPHIDVPMKTQEVLQVTREVIEERMGLKLGKVQVSIKHAPYPKE